MAVPARAAPGNVNWIAVQSSWIARVAFRQIPGSTYGHLYLETKKKADGPITGQYQYTAVPRTVWQLFQSAGSKGQAYHRLLKGRYSESRIG